MSTVPDDRVQRLFGGAHLAALRKRLRRRFACAQPDQACESFRIGGLTPNEHAALAKLMGHRPRFSHSLRIDLRVIDDALQQAGIAASLRAALERLDGPIIHLAAARDRLSSTWSQVFDDSRHPDLIRFLRAPAAMGLVKRLSSGDPATAIELRCRVETVLQRLPARGLTRAQLAADVLGNAHALDNGRAIATLVLAVWRQIVAPGGEAADALVDFRDQDGVQQDSPGEKARDVWARAGILVNELARPALFLNLPVGGATGEAGKPGEPGYLSLRALLRSPPPWAVAGRTVYVCENPNLLAIAADRFGQFCAPMVCTDGMPAAAQSRLLSQLAQAGARLLYHGDFDWPGLHIGNHVMCEYGAQPWRFGAADYAAAVRSAPRPGHRLEGTEVLASWNDELTSIMKQYQLTVAEEGVVASLLRDLDDTRA